MKKCGNKFCKKFGLEISILDFPKHKDGKNGFYTYCRECTNSKRRESYRKPEINKIVRQRNLKYSQTLKARFYKYKFDAKKRKLVFELTLDEFSNITNKECYYCDSFSTNKNFTGVDRVNSKNGYIINNCVPCCDVCNYMKSDLEFETLFQHCRLIVTKETKRRILLQKRYDIEYESFL